MSPSSDGGMSVGSISFERRYELVADSWSAVPSRMYAPNGLPHQNLEPSRRRSTFEGLSWQWKSSAQSV